MSWSRVQGFAANNWTGSNISSLPVTLGSAVAVGDLIVFLTTVGDDPTLLTSSCADNLGGGTPNVYNRLSAVNGGQLYTGAGGNAGFDAWWCVVTQAGTPTITYTIGGSFPFVAFKGSHFTGSDAASTRRASKGQYQSFPGTAADAILADAGTIASQNNDLLWVGSGDPTNGFTTMVAGTGFTASVIDATTQMIDEWLTAAGAHLGSYTDATNGGGAEYMTIALAFSPASGGGGSTALYEANMRNQYYNTLIRM